jgi:CTP:molybdopterin cytidylyltransferase MocA
MSVAEIMAAAGRTDRHSTHNLLYQMDEVTRVGAADGRSRAATHPQIPLESLEKT